MKKVASRFAPAKVRQNSHESTIGNSSFPGPGPRTAKLLAVAVAMFLTTSSAAFAATLTGTYAITLATDTSPNDKYFNSGENKPNITKNGNSGSVNGHTITTLSDPFKEVLSLGSITSPVPFFIATPTGNSCGSYGSCSNYTTTGIISVLFDFTDGAQTLAVTETATYQARYRGSYLTCSGKTGTGQSDCIDWNGATNATATGTLTFNLDFLNGDTFGVTLYNAEDWSIAPYISFSEPLKQGTTPLPAALPLFASGLGALSLLGWRRKRKAQAAT